MRSGHLLVDGYNVIRLTPPYRHLADAGELEAARVALVADVAAYAAGSLGATVVFDGGANPLSTGEAHEMLGVTVIFSRHGMDADSVIEGLARRLRERGDPVEVVTSDAQTQWAVMGGSVRRRSSAEFARDLREEDDDRRGHSPSGRASARVEDLIDPVVRSTLDRWARGES
jgi:hypothetical protein